MGRPSSYSETLVETICQRIAEGESLRSICRDDAMPVKQTVLNWLNDPKRSEFVAQYTRARVAQADHFAEEILEIADDGVNDTYVKEDGTEIVNHDHIARSRLRVDSRKWLMSKMAPKKYGDKLDLEHSGGVKVEKIERTIVDPRHPDS